MHDAALEFVRSTVTLRAHVKRSDENVAWSRRAEADLMEAAKAWDRATAEPK